jgi:hypothetical protein
LARDCAVHHSAGARSAALRFPHLRNSALAARSAFPPVTKRIAHLRDNHNPPTPEVFFDGPVFSNGSGRSRIPAFALPRQAGARARLASRTSSVAPSLRQAESTPPRRTPMGWAIRAVPALAQPRRVRRASPSPLGLPPVAPNQGRGGRSSGLSYTHLEKPHRGLPTTTAAETPTAPAAPPGSAQRGVLWISLIVIAIVVAVGRMTSPAPAQVSTPPQTVAQTVARVARAAEDEKLTEINRAALGVTQIRHAITYSNTLKLSRVAVMPTGAICYRLHLRNSRGVTYVRTAVLNGAELMTSGSEGFTALWNSRCSHQSGGRDMTAEVENAIPIATG